MGFTKLGLLPDLLRAVKAMGFTKPTPIQDEAIPLALTGVDVMGCAQTGSGKTVAFALPILQALKQDPKQGLRAVILVPTRELAAQVAGDLRDCARFVHIKTAMIIGGVGYHGQRAAVREGAQILVATPGRLLDHMRQGSFRFNIVDHLVLDEADRMLDMGFLPDIRAIIQRLPKNRQTMLFSATLQPRIESVAYFALRKPHRIELSKPSSTAEGISQVIYPVDRAQKTEFLIAFLRAVQIRSVLIFCRTRRGADRLAYNLKTMGFHIGVLHAAKTQGQRTATMESFRKGKVQILVATDIAARGIDVQEISHVINYDVPQHPEDYVHRVGRTARAYSVGDAITLMDLSERAEVAAIERFTGITFPRAMLPDFPYSYPPLLHVPKPRAGGMHRLSGRFGSRVFSRRIKR
ncbi:DEAD/DEAH box helicase [Elusimicrobiota bacterium]